MHHLTISIIFLYSKKFHFTTLIGRNLQMLGFHPPFKFLILQKLNPKKIVATGLLTGLLDICAAMIKFYIDTGKGPAPIFKYIASAVFGMNAFTGSEGMIAWGIIFHFAIAILFTAFLLVIYPMVRGALKSNLVIAIVYGLFVWIVMNLLILPLTNIPPRPAFDLREALIGMGILIIAIGLPVAIVGKKIYGHKD